MVLTTTTDRSGPYTGNGVTTVFAYGFKVNQLSHLKVYDVTTGTEVELTSGWTADGIGSDSGGNVTFTTAPAINAIIQPRRVVPYSQLTDYQNEAAVRPAQVEDDLDLIGMLAQQIAGALNLPFSGSRANQYLAFDSNGTLGVTGTAPKGQYLGEFTSAGEPTTRLDGFALQAGDWYFNSTLSRFKVWTGSAFIVAVDTAAGIDITGMTAEADMAALDVLPFFDDSAPGNRKVTLPDLYKAISVLTALGVPPAVTDSIAIYDLSALASRKLTIQNLLGGISNLPSETLPAINDVVHLFDASATASRKMTFQDILKTIDLLTVDSSPDLTADYVPVYDASAMSVKKVLLNKIGGLGAIRGTPIATTSGTAHGFTSLPAGLNQIVFMLAGVSLDGSDRLMLQIGDTGGYENSSYVSRAGGSNETTGFLIVDTTGAAKTYSGSVTLNRIDSNTWLYTGLINTDTGSTIIHSVGSKTLSAELDRIQILPTGADAFDAGSVNVLY